MPPVSSKPLDSIRFGSKKLLCFCLMFFVVFAASAAAQGNSGKTKDKKKDKPAAKSKTPIPYVTQLEYFTQGATGTVTILGEVSNNFGFEASKGNEAISASFSNPGIAVEGISVLSGSSLVISFSVSPDSALGGASITVTNPKADPSTSVESVLSITDVPEIMSADISPKPLSVVDDLVAEFSVSNEDDSLTLDYEYEWFESDSLDAANESLLAETASILPASKTHPGKFYRCVVKPIKGKSKGLAIAGKSGSSPRVKVNADADGNGIHDTWEVKKLGQRAVDAGMDFDGDGYSNRTEYLFGLDPTKNASEKPIAKSLDPKTGQFGYTRASLQLADVDYRIEISTDLVNWTESNAFTTFVDQIDADTELVEVELAQSIIDANPQLFVRVSVN